MSSLLYAPSPTHIDVDTFCDKIKNDPGSFTQFKVLRITHIKDLGNWVWHEYVQMIIRDISNGKLLRVLAERVKDNDKVTVGMWNPWTEGEKPPSGNGDPGFPLPLLSLFFETPLELSDVANILSAVRAVHPPYNLLTANCYWFALSVFNSLQSHAGNSASLKKWSWWKYRGFPPIPLIGPEKSEGTSFTIVEMADPKMPMIVKAESPVIKKRAILTRLSDVDDTKDVSTTDTENVTTGGIDVTAADTNDASTDDIIVTPIDIKDASTDDIIVTIDSEDISTTNTSASGLLALTREIFEGQISEAEYEAATVNFPLIYVPYGSNRASEAFKTILRRAQLIESGVSGESQPTYAEEVRTFFQEFVNDPAMKEHVGSVLEGGSDEIFLPLKADNMPPECEEGVEKLGTEWCLSQDDCDKLNFIQRVTLTAVRKTLKMRKLES